MRLLSPRSLFALAAAALCALSLWPLADRELARREARRLVAGARGPGSGVALTGGAPAEQEALALLAGVPCPGSLQAWSDVGGCGAGGGSSGAAAGGAKWVGRGTSGGLVDLQLLSTLAYSHENYFSSFSLRLGTGVLPKWDFGVNVPVLYKVGDVDVLGQTRTAHVAGFGDVSLEVTRKLGITNASLLTLTLGAPSGAYDAVREGIVLPQHLQLGSGVLGASLQFEHAWDRDWGLIIAGGNAAYNGWENGIGDFRSPTASAYTYVGYLWGPLVPSAGLTLFAKPLHDQERGEARPDGQDPLFMVVPSLALEWSVDWLALLLHSSTSFSYNGFEGVAVTLGVSTSLF